MAPKVTSCDTLGMYWLSTEGGFTGGARVNLVGVLVSGGLLWCLVSVVINGVTWSACGRNLVSVRLNAVMFAYWLCCFVGCCCEL